MSNYNGDISFSARNFQYGTVLPEVKECMNDLLNNVVKRASYQTALGKNTSNAALSYAYQQYDMGARGRKIKEKKQVTTNPYNTANKQREYQTQKALYTRKVFEEKKTTEILRDSKKTFEIACGRVSTLEIELTRANSRASDFEHYIKSLPEPKVVQKPTRSLPPAVPPVIPLPLHELRGPDHLLASQLPPDFPPELTFRALSSYALLRSLSLPLRLSPFTPTAFLRALVIPLPTRLLGEIHVALLRYLYASIKVGTYDARGNFRKDLHKRVVRGGQNLNYMDPATWTLFYEDYVELSVEKFVGDEDDFESKNLYKSSYASERNGRYKKGVSSTSGNYSIRRNGDIDNEREDEAADEVDEVLRVDEDESENDDDSDSGSDTEEYSEHSMKNNRQKGKRKRGKKFSMNRRPSRGAKLEAVKRLKETKSDDETMSFSDEEASLSDPGIKRKPTTTNKSLSATSNLPIKKKRGRPRKQTADGQPLANSSKTAITTNSAIQAKHEPISNVLYSDVEIASNISGKTPTTQSKILDKVPPFTKANMTQRAHSTEIVPTDNVSRNTKKSDGEIQNYEDPIKKKPGRPRKKKRKNDDNDKAYVEKKPPSERQSNVGNSMQERRGPGRPPSNPFAPEPISSTISTAVNYFLSTPPNLPLKPHISPLVQAKVTTLETLSHFNAARKLRHGRCYPNLSVVTKLEMLEFILDEFLGTFPIACELLHRHRITSYYPGQYGLLPTPKELMNLTNVDECVVCGIEGDLVCCDGCIASYHCKCADLPLQENLPEGVWLCPECKIPSPAKLGPLYGGAKCELDWFNMRDFMPIVNAEELSKSLANLKRESDQPTESKPMETTENKSQDPTESAFDGENETTNASRIDGINGSIILDKETLRNITQDVELGNESRTKAQGQQQNNSDGADRQNLDGRNSALSHPALRPTITISDERDFLIIHGFIFTRRKQPPLANTPPSPPLPLTQSELFDLLRSLGPLYALNWPWCQIPFNPFEVWKDFDGCFDMPTLRLFEEKRQFYSQYFTAIDSHNPTAYENLYRQAQLPPYIAQAQGNNYTNFRREESLRLQVVHGLTRDLSKDSRYIKSIFSHRSHYDILQGCKDYIIKLEKMLFRSCFLEELWGVNKKLIPDEWVQRVWKCKKVSTLAKLCVELVDVTHSRAFYEDWNKPYVASRSKQHTEAIPKTQNTITDDWTPEKECRRRDWERSSYRNSLRLLKMEGNHVQGWMSGRKRRKIFRLDLTYPALPTLKASSMISRDIKPLELPPAKPKEVTEPKNEELKPTQDDDNEKSADDMKVKADLAMTPGAIRARARRKREREERERYRDEMFAKLKRETEFTEKLLSMDAAQIGNFEEIRTIKDIEGYDTTKTEEDLSIDEIKPPVSVESQPDIKPSPGGKGKKTTKGKKGKKKFVPLVERRRSGRNLARPLTVEEAINSLSSDATRNAALSQMLSDQSIDFEIKKIRRVKIANLEKLLNKHADREIHWPICGGYFFPPLGSLPRPVLKRLARNAGMRPAPFMTYSTRFEVAQPSVSHCWRQQILGCRTVDELTLQLTISDSFINRPTIHSCDTLARRSTHTKSQVPKIIRCTHYDSESGMIEYFVVNRKKGKGVWLTEEAVDQSALILERSNRVEYQQKKFSQKVLEKRKLEKQKKEKEEKQIIEKRLAEGSLKSARSHIVMVQKSLIIAKQEAVDKQETMKRVENELANMKLEVQRENMKLEVLQTELSVNIDTINQRNDMGQFSDDTPDAQLERAFMEYIDNDIQSLNLQRMQDPRGMGGRAGRGAGAKATRGRGGRGQARGRGYGQETNANSFSSLLLDESRYQHAFLDAAKRHREATKSLLKESAELGLNTVPVEKMNDARVIHMAEMKEANNKLLKMKSSKYVDDDGLTKALADAEDAGLQMYIKEAEKKKKSKSVMNHHDSMSSSARKRPMNGRNQKQDSQAYMGDVRAKQKGGYSNHPSGMDQNALRTLENQVDKNMGLLERQLAQQQHVQQMGGQSLLSNTQQFSQPDQSDYAAMSNALAQSEFNLLSMRNNIGQRIGNDMNNSYLLDLDRQNQGYQRENQMLMQPSQLGENLIGDIRQQFSSLNPNLSTFGNNSSNFQTGNALAQSLQAQQFSGQYSDTYNDPSMVGYDQNLVNGTPYHSLDNSFAQQVQQRNTQSFMRGAPQQRNLPQRSNNHSSLQNNINPMDFNLW